MSRPLLEVKDLKQHFRINRRFTTKAVDGISFTVDRGQTFGLVGESGSGKSTTGRSIIRLYTPSAGEIFFDGHRISGPLDAQTRRLVRTKIQMVFQDPMASLNPRKTVLDIVSEGLMNLHPELSVEQRKEKVSQVLEQVGLSADFVNRYPHQFSGGQRQRIGLARALIMEPQLIIADEPISALDVSIQAQVVNLLKRIQRELGITMIFIAHDLSMVRYISDRIGVMHLGHIVEIGDRNEIFTNPLHPYTLSLLSAIPQPNPVVEKKRRSLGYLYHQGGIDYTKGTLHDVSATHQVLAIPQEFEKWKAGDYSDTLTESHRVDPQSRQRS